MKRRGKAREDYKEYKKSGRGRGENRKTREDEVEQIERTRTENQKQDTREGLACITQRSLVTEQNPFTLR